MSGVKPFASLSSTLLARKGQAKPAMRPYGFAAPGSQDDLGWNDLGTPVARSEVHRQQADIAEQLGVAIERRDDEPSILAVKPERATVAEPVKDQRAAAGAKGRVAFTLRLDHARHRALRAMCAAERRSAQAIVTEALDRLLAAKDDRR